MNEFAEKAVRKLREEKGKGGFDKYGSAMKDDVLGALEDFVGQDEEFARAVLDGGSLQECMKAVGKCVKGNAISDLDAYTAAAGFYFPGAKIRVTMRIDLIGDAAKNDEGGIVIDLADFFG